MGQQHTTPVTLPMVGRPVLEYTDSFNNTFVIYVNEGQYVLHFKPISERESSSGMSGGTPYSRKITIDEFKQVEQAFNTMEGNTASHTTERTMGSTIFVKYENTTVVKRFLVSFGENALFDDLIKRLR